MFKSPQTFLICLFLPLFGLRLGNAFEAVPFLQIDYHFYLRLAQCQAKCAEKFTATAEEPQGGINSLLELCNQGCLDSDSPVPRQQESSGQSLAFSQGQHFFRHSIGHRRKTVADAASSQNQLQTSIRPLCAQRMALGTDSPHEKYEAILIIDEGGQQAGPQQFVVRWRRMAKERRELREDNSGEQPEEPQWITASIEPSATFRVTSLRPGLLHQFQVQPVSTHGPLGEPVISEWIDFTELALRGEGFGHAALHFFSQYNAEHGVAAWVRWGREESTETQNQKPVLNHRLKRMEAIAENQSGHQLKSGRPLVFPSCQLQIEWANKSSRVVEQFELDASGGFLLRHLAFKSDYSVRIIAANQLPPLDQSLHAPRILLEANFLSMHCTQVFGPASLECEPEPVSGLAISEFPENGTALISWERPLAVGNILLYELAIEPIKDATGACHVGPAARIVSSQATSALISLPVEAVCEFELRLTVYDLLGRDATAQQRFQFVPAGHSQPNPVLQQLLKIDASLLALLFVLVLVPAIALITLVCTVSRMGTTRRRKAATKQATKSSKKEEKRMAKEAKAAKNGNGKSGRNEPKMASPTVETMQQQQSACNSPQSSLISNASTAAGTETTTLPTRSWRETGEVTTTDEEELIAAQGGINGGNRSRMGRRPGSVLTTVAMGEL